MQEFETSQDEQEVVDGDGSPTFVRFAELFRYLLKRLVVFVAFGPGILGVLWLIGRIFKR
jgi:hypothetical protein